MNNLRNNSPYSKRILLVVRYIAVITLILLTIVTSRGIYSFVSSNFYSMYDTSVRIKVIINILINLVIIVFAFLLIYKPERFFLIGIGSLLYSLSIAFMSSSSTMSLLMLGVSIATFVIRFNTKKKYTFIIFGTIYIVELLLPLLQKVDSYIEVVLTKIGITFTLLIMVYFFSEYAKQKGINIGTKEKILNIALYPGLERSDLMLLQDVLNNMKYKDIAHKIHGSEGALRNKLSRIYKILEVGDRTGFLTIYSGYKLIFEPENNI